VNDRSGIRPCRPASVRHATAAAHHEAERVWRGRTYPRTQTLRVIGLPPVSCQCHLRFREWVLGTSALVKSNIHFWRTFTRQQISTACHK